MTALLQVENLTAGYGASRVLFDVNLVISEGEVATLLGRNGMGKSTLVKCLCGWLTPTSGRITFAGEDISKSPSHHIGKLGLGLVPEGRQVFPTLTVRENLVATASTANGRAWTIDRVVGLFPRLGERMSQLGGTLSGGEQRQLEIAMALATEPRLLLLDEPLAGMSQVESAAMITLLKSLKGRYPMLLVEHDMEAVFALADRVIVLVYGRIIATDTPNNIRSNREVRAAYLGEEEIT